MIFFQNSVQVESIVESGHGFQYAHAQDSFRAARCGLPMSEGEFFTSLLFILQNIAMIAFRWSQLFYMKKNEFAVQLRNLSREKKLGVSKAVSGSIVQIIIELTLYMA